MKTRWRPNNRITFQKWDDCDGCGLPWPKKLLRLQRGSRRCPECYDEPCHEDAKRESLQEPMEKPIDPWSEG